MTETLPSELPTPYTGFLEAAQLAACCYRWFGERAWAGGTALRHTIVPFAYISTGPARPHPHTILLCVHNLRGVKHSVSAVQSIPTLQVLRSVFWPVNMVNQRCIRRGAF